MTQVSKSLIRDNKCKQQSILKVLVYFDIFHYPLTSKEIKSFLDQSIDETELENTLEELLMSGRIFQLEEFYSLQNNISLAERRRKGNLYAEVLIRKAEKIAKLLYKFPYIRAIGLSGSLSKNFADENADIDYFIITKGNRLWIARTLLILYRKNPFLKHRMRYYCLNYFIDEASLIIKEKNIYTATELYTLMPLAGNGILQNFFDTNTWSHSYFPNNSLPILKKEINYPDPLWKKMIEFLLNNKIGDWLDNHLFRFTARRWENKEKRGCLNLKGEKMGLDNDKHYSKNSPIFFHDSFLNRYKKRLEEININ